MNEKTWQMLQFLNNYGPEARAEIKGSIRYPSITGSAQFWQMDEGVLVMLDVTGLPHETGNCMAKIFACHIHENGNCTDNRAGNASADAGEPFAYTGTHYNPTMCRHPYHAGDLEPLFGNEGKAFYLFLTNRFSVKDIVGRSVVIHLHADDFHEQTSGNAGEKIACGRIIGM